MVMVLDPHEEILLAFWAVEAKKLSGAMKRLEKEVEDLVQKPKLKGKAAKTKLNGLTAMTVDGTGEVEGQTVELRLVILKTPTDQFLAVVVFAETEHFQAHEGAVEAIFESVKPVK